MRQTQGVIETDRHTNMHNYNILVLMMRKDKQNQSAIQERDGAKNKTTTSEYFTTMLSTKINCETNRKRGMIMREMQTSRRDYGRKNLSESQANDKHKGPTDTGPKENNIEPNDTRTVVEQKPIIYEGKETTSVE